MTTTLPAKPADRDDVRRLLEGMYVDLTAEHEAASAALAEVARSSDRDGDDEIDAGAKTAEREHQLSVVATLDERMGQVQRAIDRLDAGGYGVCDACGQPITAERLDAFPSATACVECKRAEERRS
jgi:DnaK suppressor protein